MNQQKQEQIEALEALVEDATEVWDGLRSAKNEAERATADAEYAEEDLRNALSESDDVDVDLERGIERAQQLLESLQEKEDDGVDLTSVADRLRDRIRSLHTFRDTLDGDILLLSRVLEDLEKNA